jgi:NADH:ubiquinone oxidoreductase subunit 6 (subunit J)
MRLPETIPFLGWAWDDLLFLALAGVLLGAAIFVAVGRNIIRSGLSMVLSFAALAGIYVLLGAPLVAAAQVLIYIGAISVLVLFAIMLTQTKDAPASLVFQTQALGAGVAAVLLAIVIAITVGATDWPDVAGRIRTATDELAQVLFRDYVLAFEVVSVLLLAAVIGGIYVAKREEGGPP